MMEWVAPFCGKKLGDLRGFRVGVKLHSGTTWPGSHTKLPWKGLWAVADEKTKQALDEVLLMVIVPL